MKIKGKKYRLTAARKRSLIDGLLVLGGILALGLLNGLVEMIP
jgi:hypothetical protein